MEDRLLLFLLAVVYFVGFLPALELLLRDG